MVVAAITRGNGWTTLGAVAWAQLALAATLGFIYLPSLLFVFAVMGDAEQLFFKSNGIISHEAGHLVGIARPIAALFSNMPLYFLDTLADFRLARAFSLLNLILVGCAMIRIMATRLWIPPAIAMVVAVGTLCLPGFIFSMMNPTAWPMHLLSFAFAVVGYGLAARSHSTSLFLTVALRDLDRWSVREALVPLWRLGSVIGALLLFQLSLFTYPPNSLLILVFPVAMLLFAPLPALYRQSLLIRDLSFVFVGIVIFVVVSKAFYFPVGNLIGLPKPADGPASIYRFVFDFNWSHVIGRLLNSLRVAKDLWFLPNFEIMILSVYATIAALVVLGCLGKHRRVRFIRRGAAPAATIAGCYVVSVAPVIFSLGGLISYRTVLAATAIFMLVLLYLLRKAIRSLAGWLGRAPAAEPAWVALILTTICGATLYSICSVIQISQNEMAWAIGTLREMKNSHADGLVVIDGRRMISPDELRMASDVHGHALMPYESGCFSSYCIAAPGIYHIARRNLAVRPDAMHVMIVRNDALDGVTCNDLLDNSPPHGGFLRGWSTTYRWPIVLGQFLQENPKFECREYDTKWLDLEWDGASSKVNTENRIDQSIWRILLPK